MERNHTSRTGYTTQEELHLHCLRRLQGGGLLIVVTR